MMKRMFFRSVILALCIFNSLYNVSEAQETGRPKLVVGIVIDQMRPEYLTRFNHQFGDNGFRRLMNEGFVCANTHINYVPTITGPGHASIYSGTTPKYHGIVENDWYDRELKKKIYCSSDYTAKTVGNDSAENHSYSAKNMLVSNIADELKLSTNKHGKVVAISLKDRGATLPAGHLGDEAYWFDQKTGNFVTSTFYMKELPVWVKKFNSEKRTANYLEKTWDLLLPEKDYSMSISDDYAYEKSYFGMDKPAFPYNLKQLASKTNSNYSVIYNSPFGNTLLTDFSLQAIKNNNLGADVYPDLLTISYSSPDAVGHKFGPLSKELNDLYIRLDLDIARLLDALDSVAGKGNYILFLTADHAMGDVPGYLTENKIPAGYLNSKIVIKELRNALNNKFGENSWIESVASSHIYLNHSLINKHNISLETVQDFTAQVLREIKGVSEVFTATQLTKNEYTQGIAGMVQKGFNFKRCGDVIFILEPGWTEEMDIAATHGSPYTYDTNIPLIWFGNKIRKGESYIHYNVTDIAPTISAFLKIKYPNACIGNPIVELLNK